MINYIKNLNIIFEQLISLTIGQLIRPLVKLEYFFYQTISNLILKTLTSILSLSLLSIFKY